MKRRTRWVIAAAIGVAAGAGAGGGVAMAGGESETPITGPALKSATEAALAYTHGGTVTETEVGDEESRYEVEVTLSNGKRVDVQLDDAFGVVGSKTDTEGGD